MNKEGTIGHTELDQGSARQRKCAWPSRHLHCTPSASCPRGASHPPWVVPRSTVGCPGLALQLKGVNLEDSPSCITRCDA